MLLIFVTVLYVIDLAEETCLIPQPEEENERLQPEKNYNFMSECFYMTHRCINLGLIILLVFTKCIMKSHIRENGYPLDGTLSRKDIIMFHFNNFDKKCVFHKTCLLYIINRYARSFGAADEIKSRTAQNTSHLSGRSETRR